MLTEGALMLAIYIVMLIISINIPIISVIMQFFLILPFILYSAKYPMKYVSIYAIGAIFLSFIVGSIVGLAFTFLYGATGIMMGYGIRKKESKQTIYIASSMTLLGSIIFFIVITAVFFKINFLDEFTNLYRTSINQYTDTLERLGQSPPAELQEQLDQMINLISSMAPSLFIGTAFISVIILMVIHFPIIKRLGVDVPKFQPFRDFKFPKSILWLYLIVLLVSLFTNSDSGTYMHMALLNASFILQTLLVIQGLAFVYYYANAKKWPTAIPIIAVVLTIFIPTVLMIVRLIGIIDLGFDLRQRLNKK